MRLLWARAGRTYCPNDGTRIERDTVDQVAGDHACEPEGSRWYALFPVRCLPNPPAAPHAQLFGIVCLISARKASIGLFQGGQTFEFSARNRCSTSISQSPYISLRPPRRFGPICISEWWIRSKSAIARPVKFSSRGGRGQSSTLHFSRALRLQNVRPSRGNSGADAVQFQQPHRCMSDMPGLRQHDRLRFRSDNSRSVRYPCRTAPSIHGRSRNTPGITKKN